MRILISLLVLVSLYACTPVYAQESGVIVSGVSTSLRSNKGPLTLETAESKPINFVFGSGTASPVTLSLSETGALTGLTSSTFTSLTGTSATSLIATNTADAADNKIMSIAGGGAAGTSRGAYIDLHGNENASLGLLSLISGNTASGHIDFQTSNASANIRARPAGNITWTFGSTGNLTQDATNGGDITGGQTNFSIRQGTSDATDNKALQLAGGGAIASATRGGYITLNGNESGSPGNSVISAGDLAAAALFLDAPGTNGAISFRTNGATNRWSIGGTGILTSDATNGGGIVLAGTGDTLAVDSGTAASACKGTVTANGTTAVVVSTTCAATGANIIIARTSAPSGTAQCWTDTIVNGTSFNFDCSAAETGTYSWWILKEG